MKTQKLIQLLSAIDPQELFQATFPFSTNYESLVHTTFIEKGIADWPTWFLMFKSEADVHGGHQLLTICGHSDFTGIKYVRRENLSLEKYIHRLKVKSSDPQRWPLLDFYHNIGENVPITINEANRMWNFLCDKGITLFEPTK